jgi:hypothetical protein
VSSQFFFILMYVERWITQIIGKLQLLLSVSRKMQDPTDSVATSRSHVDSGHNAKSKKKPDGSPKLGTICSCPCGNSIPNDSMIKVQLS